MGQGAVPSMHPPGIRMNMNPNVPHAGINVGGPNPNANMMNDWSNGPRFGNPGPNANAMRSPNPAQMVAQNPMQGNQVNLKTFLLIQVN